MGVLTRSRQHAAHARLDAFYMRSAKISSARIVVCLLPNMRKHTGCSSTSPLRSPIASVMRLVGVNTGSSAHRCPSGISLPTQLEKLKMKRSAHQKPASVKTSPRMTNMSGPFRPFVTCWASFCND